MAITTITGSNGIGTFLEGMNQDVITIVQGIQSMNDPRALAQIKGMNFLDTYIREVEGVAGHTEGFKEYKVYASDIGSYSDAISYKESYETWSFNRRGYALKDRDFTHEMIQEAYETGKSTAKLVDDRMMAISRMYLNQYLPNVAYETLFIVPEVGGRYYDEPTGFLRDVEIDPSMLKVYAQGKTLRNHYMQTENTQTGGGVSYEDIDHVVRYLSEYKDISDGNIIAIANGRTIFKLKSVFQYADNKDTFARTGQLFQEIVGVKFISNDFMPTDMILFLSGDVDSIITKLISPKADLRGVAMIKESGFQKLENISDLVGSQFKIMPEGYHLTGRHYGIFLNINPATGNANREMQTDGFNMLRGHASQLRGEWYNGLR